MCWDVFTAMLKTSDWFIIVLFKYLVYSIIRITNKQLRVKCYSHKRDRHECMMLVTHSDVISSNLPVVMTSSQTGAQTRCKHLENMQINRILLTVYFYFRRISCTTTFTCKCYWFDSTNITMKL